MATQNSRLYHIRIGTQLDGSWQEWFDGLEIQPNPDGTTTLSGIIDDQAVLHTMLNKIRNLNIDLISLTFDEISTQPHQERIP